MSRLEDQKPIIPVPCFDKAADQLGLTVADAARLSGPLIVYDFERRSRC
jgi:hypothetical protein